MNDLQNKLRDLFDRIKKALDSLIQTLNAWLEWQAAKDWAKEYHPGWVQIATKARDEEPRLIYRDKILKAYRGEFEDGE